MSTESIPPRVNNGEVPLPVRIVLEDPSYSRGLEPEVVEALVAKARAAGKGLAEFARDLLVAGSE